MSNLNPTAPPQSKMGPKNAKIQTKIDFKTKFLEFHVELTSILGIISRLRQPSGIHVSKLRVLDREEICHSIWADAWSNRKQGADDGQATSRYTCTGTVCTYTDTNTHTLTHTYMYTYIYIHTCTHMQSYIHIYIYYVLCAICMYVHIVYIYIYIIIHIIVYIYILVHGLYPQGYDHSAFIHVWQSH